MTENLSRMISQLLPLALAALAGVIFVLVIHDRQRAFAARIRARAIPHSIVEAAARKRPSPFGVIGLLPPLNDADDALLILIDDTLLVFDRLRLFGRTLHPAVQKYCWAGDRCCAAEIGDFWVIDNVVRSGDALEFTLYAARPGLDYSASFTRFRRRLFDTTKSELKAIAPAARIGPYC